ncbi:MAG: ATP-binding protein [Ferruginibacter sp.]
MILIVDDRPENVFSLKSILDLHSFPVDTAYSGEEALKKTLKNKYALIILDVQMPGMDGFEVAEILSGNKSTQDIPIIFLSAVNTDKKFITKGYTSGAIDYIVKPIDPDILLLKVKTFYRLYEQNRDLIQMQEELRSEIEFRKNAQQQIQEKAQELNGILTSIPQVAFTATPEGKIEYVNDNWYEYSKTTSFPIVPNGEEPIISAWQKSIPLANTFEMELRIAKLGTENYRFHLLRIVPIKKDNEIVKWVGTFTDIEEQKKALQTKDEFLSIASHELKTPLTSIKAYLQLLNKMGAGDSSTKNFIDRSLVQVNKLDGLINDLLDVSKIESGKLKFELEEICFETLLKSTLEILSQIYPDIIISRKGNFKAIISGNALRLEQVIINLISNAIKYSPQQKQVEIIGEKTDDNRFYFGIKDFGIGIPKENQQDIFNKFYRVSETSSHAQGLGIGLYICSEILARHNADFGVESEPGKGSLFYFVLPVARFNV